MENEITPRSVGMKYGLILGLASILVSALNFMFIGRTDGPASYIGFVLMIVAMVLAMREYKSQGDSFMSFGQGFGIGFFTSLISGIISAVFTYIYLSYIDDTILETAKNEAIMQMEQQNVPAEAYEMMDFFTSPGFVSGAAVLGSVIVGIIFSLIISAIMKKDRPEFGM
jgi:drug/metabolite transporter (DMT)-like permease